MLTTLLMALGAAVIAVVVGLILVGTLARGGVPALARLFGGQWAGLEPQVEPLMLLFRNKSLLDATRPARKILEVLPGADDWQRLMAWLAVHMPESGAVLKQDLHDHGRVELTAPPGPGRAPFSALLEDLGDGHLRVMLRDPAAGDSGTVVDSLTLAAMEEEIGLLRGTMDSSPMLAWREDENGAITWANSAYLQLVEAGGGGDTIWPLPRLIPLAEADASLTPQRAQVEIGGEIRWYECHSRISEGQIVAIALPADAAVRAEQNLREFVQTLTKTFADLPIGMAIFDRERNLQLFNPALLDLTGLAAGFLIARPTLYSFLDRLREARMVPEPKDYRSWRNQMSTLESAAASGYHVETWSLPGGQTYRVTGRPHPDGAVAFLFEDITSETSLTRKFRAELSLGREVLDGLTEAVAVFSGTGQKVIQNSAYITLWGGNAGGFLADHLQLWQGGAGDDAGLKRLKDALDGAGMGMKEPVNGTMTGPEGQQLFWNLRFLTGGRLLIGFDDPAGAALPSAPSGPVPGRRHHARGNRRSKQPGTAMQFSAGS